MEAISNRLCQCLRRVRFFVVVITLAVVVGVGSAKADAIRGVVEVEGETFGASHNLGGLPIRVSTCDVASGGHVADGVDVPAEWIELSVSLPVTRSFDTSIAFQGELDLVNTVRMTVRDPDSGEVILAVDYLFIGGGIG